MSPKALLLILACLGMASIALAQDAAQTAAAEPSAVSAEASDHGSIHLTATSRPSPTEELPLLSLSADRAARSVGVETTVLWPFFPGNLFQLRATVPVAFEGRGQLLLGVQGHVPHSRSEEGRFSSLAAHIGFRAYLWKGLHVDAMTNLGVGRLEGSVVDGRDYSSFDVELLATAGWRFEVGPAYALVQPLGIGAVVYRSNPWAIVGEGRKTTEPPIYIGNLVLGLQL